ncbi:MAG TPA: sigma-70 family RNA polymerase sigma factor, partial [Afifellaceae bacterium]|nr:sigma-70 family RNA polymerase sigma factor [Afifellaceae bacterium]
MANDDDERRAAELLEVRAIAAGDEKAFARLIDREGPRLLRFAKAMLGSLDEAEDVAQETFISLWENAAGWRPEARIGTWLHRVCINRAIDRVRRRRDFAEADALDAIADSGPLAEAGMLRDEAIRSVH